MIAKLPNHQSAPLHEPPNLGRARMKIGGSGSQVSEAERGRRALRAASLAFFVDAFDAYVPVLALAPAQEYFLPATMPVAERATAAYFVFFAIAWAGRPLGCFLFGHLGDTIGRRNTTIISMAGFGLCTLLMALMPGYAQLGLTAVIIFGALRLVGGMFIGGEYTGAAPLAIEYAPPEKRGLWGSLCNIGYPSALAVNTLLTFLLLQIIPAGGPDAPYSLWGWRIPFVIGALMAVAMTIYYYRAVPESELWLGAKKSPAPLKELFASRLVLRFIQVFILNLGAWLTLNPVAGSLSTFLHVILKVPSSLSTLAIFISTAIGALLFPLTGMLGQRIGRKQLYAILGVVNIFITPGLYVLLAWRGYQSAGMLILLVTLIQIPTLVVWALLTAYITESFPTRVRASGYGLGFSLATVPAAFYSFGLLALKRFMPYQYTLAVVLALGGLLLLVGALLGPDNRHIDFRKETGELE